MKNLNKILSEKEIDKLIAKGKAEYKGWGIKSKELVYVGRLIYWNHTIKYNQRFYYYIGNRDRKELKKIK